MKKSNLLIAAVFAALVSSEFVSCKHNLIPEPTIDTNASKNPADYADAILPPKEVTATHGGYRNITLEWTPVENAVRYQIFYAKTPFDTFEKLVETTDASTTYNIDAPSGSTYYFFVKAVNYYETVSAESLKTTGSTLAIPIITKIDSPEDAQSVTIDWWMDNCSKETYQESLKFTIKVYDSQKKEIPGSSVTKDGDCRSVEVSGLSPSTEYFFTVQADISGTVQKPEISDLTSKETAHSIIPASVKELNVTQGISTSQIEISWKLPEGADFFDAFTNTYSIHPVLFQLQRKDAVKDDSAFEKLGNIGVTHVINEKDSYSHPFKLDYTFDCEAETTSSELLKIDTTTAIGYVDINESYKEYQPGTTLTFTDKTVIRGKQYSYRIVAFTDDTTRIYQSDSSISDSVTGWLISPAEFKVSADYTKDEENNKYKEINISFNFEFTPFSNSYNYIITQSRTPFKTTEPPVPTAEPESIIYSSDSIASITSKVLNFDIPALSEGTEEWMGTYKYKLYITDISTTNIPEDGEYYVICESPGSITVTDDLSRLPKINHFSVEDGYSDKFVLTWDDYDETCSYSISWNPFDGDIQLEEQTFIIPKEDIIQNETTAKYNHAAVSGDVRTYCLTADNGLTTSKFFADENGKNIRCETLGTANPIMDKPDYASIKVSWAPVQKADDDVSGYEVHAVYINSDEEYDDVAAAYEELITEENCTISKDEESGNYVCEISKIRGFNDPSISGLPIKLTVTAKNSVTNNSTSKTSEVCNLGPALTFPSTNTNPTMDRLTFSWKQIEGINKYLVYRVLYADKSETDTIASDKYIITVEENGLTIENDQEIGNRASVTLVNGRFSLTDIQKDASDVYGYHLNQEKIQWGLPFGYIVLPLKDDGTKSTFDFVDNTFKTTESSAVNYGILQDKRTCTYGYGMNVTAKKSESAAEIEISWDAPNQKGLIPTVYRKPFIKGENPDYGSDWENIIPEGNELSVGTTSYSDKLLKSDISSAFVYCVQYKAPSRSNIVTSYRNELLSKMDEAHSPTEPKNKGYLLALDEFTAKYGGTGTTETSPSYFQENLTWNTQWDYEERALGPDSFTFEIKNRNLSSTMNWKPIADFKVDEKTENGEAYKTQIFVENQDYSSEKDKDYNDTTIVCEPGAISLSPTGLTSGTANSTEGFLKVLRDAKHYYSVKLTRGSVTVRQAEDCSVYAYRQISPEELCKCVGLIVADSLYACGIPNRKTYQNAGHTGEFKIACSTDAVDANKIQWQCSAYTTKFIKACSADNMGNLNSFLTLNSTTSSFDYKGISGETLYYLPELEITVTSSIALSSYQETLSFSAGGCDWTWIFGAQVPSNLKHNLKISINGKAVVDISNNKNQMYEYFPYDLGTKHITPDSSINPSLKTYQSPWWN